MSTNNGPILVTTGKVRLSYAHLTEAVAIQEGQEKKYSASFIISKSDKKTLEKIATAIKQATQRGIETKWGGKNRQKLNCHFVMAMRSVLKMKRILILILSTLIAKRDRLQWMNINMNIRLLKILMRMYIVGAMYTPIYPFIPMMLPAIVV